MDQQKRKKIIIAVIILVILVLLFWFWRSLDIFRPTTNVNNEPPKFNPPSANSDFNPDLAPNLSSDELSAVNLAKSYAERFGSWSTDQVGVNLKELAPLSTQSMNRYLNSIKPEDQPATYSGITTKSISSKIDDWADDVATITVKTQRIETKADLSTNVYYQDIKVELKKINNKWLVNSAFWQDKK